MSILIYAENAGGKFKKSAFEAVSYARAIADQNNTALTAVSIGDVSADELNLLARYGADKILDVNNAQLKSFINQAYAAVIADAAKREGANVVVMANTFSGRGLAPRVAVKLGAGLADGAVSIPDQIEGKFIVKKTAFSGKAFANVELTSAVKVISLTPNSYKVVENVKPAQIEKFDAQINEADLKTILKEIVQSVGKVSLPEAEIVVSGGRL